MTSKESLERLLNSPIVKMRNGSYLDIEIIKSIKQDLERLEKLEKAIEILKDYLMIKVSINRNNEYCLDACDYAIPHLNKEEYDLLKEYL